MVLTKCVALLTPAPLMSFVLLSLPAGVHPLQAAWPAAVHPVGLGSSLLSAVAIFAHVSHVGAGAGGAGAAHSASAPQTSSSQSESPLQPSPGGHGGQSGPPQSTSVSFPSFVPSTQVDGSQ
jgi:hypothetical protein